MRTLLAFVLMIALVGSAAAYDLGNQYKDTKTNMHVGMNPGTPDGRQGGENMADAFAISALPFGDTGNTSGNVDDYDAVCPYSGSTSPDVVYSYTPASDILLTVDLCGSGYDTKVYVMDGSMNLLGCNDDFYFDDTCGTYVSYVTDVYVTAGTEVFIVVDGYGGDSGDYVIAVDGIDPPEPCTLDCTGTAEGEPTLGAGYVDYYNSGCNDDSGLVPFQELIADQYGNLTFCGIAGWNGSTSGIRDTDWFTATLGETGVAEWTLDAEQGTYGFLLSPQDCANVAVAELIEVGPCAPATMVLQGNPGDIVWLWVGANDYYPPSGFVGDEYTYVGTFTGLMDGIIATESVSFDGIKSLYR